MTRDEVRSAHLLFGEELALGEVELDAVLASKEVRDAVRSLAVPSAPSRALQRLLVRRGGLSYESASLAPMAGARHAVLGDAAAGPPRFLVRMDEFPHAQAWDQPERYGTAAFERFHAILRDAGVPYLVAVMPRVPRHYLDPEEEAWRPHDAAEMAILQQLRRDPDVAVGVHGLDHRTRDRSPRKHSELAGLKPARLAERLDAADQVLRELRFAPDVFVAPFNRFDARQFPALAERYDIVTGGPESIGRLGFHRTPLWRGGTVHLPAYKPLYGRASEVLPAVERIAAAQPGVWVPLVLHVGWEVDDGFDGLEELAATLAGLARPWDEFSAAVRASRTAKEAPA